LAFGLRTPRAADSDVPALNLIDSVLGIGESSRLFVELREKRALAYDFATVNISGSDYGYFTIDCAVKTNLLKQTRSIIQEELNKVRCHSVPKLELEKSRNMLIGDVYRSFDNSHLLPRILAEHELYFQNEKSLQTYIDTLAQLSEQDLMEAANKYFKEENYATAIIIPRNQR
jgi:zinc protease